MPETFRDERGGDVALTVTISSVGGVHKSSLCPGDLLYNFDITIHQFSNGSNLILRVSCCFLNRVEHVETPEFYERSFTSSLQEAMKDGL